MEVHIENYKSLYNVLIIIMMLLVDYQCKMHTGFFSDLHNTVVNSCIVASYVFAKDRC